MGLGELVVVLFVLLTWGGPLVLYLRTMRTTLQLTREQHGKSPRIVWLMLIPIFNLGWHFYLVRLVASSVTKWSARTGANFGDGGLWVGLAASALTIVALVLPGDARVAAGVAALVAGIFYWVRIAKLNRMIRTQAGATVSGSASTQQA